MPNQLNFDTPIVVPYIEERPDRLSTVDRALLGDGVKQVVFGTSDQDTVEIWIYNQNSDIIGHVLLDPTNDMLSLATVVDNTGPAEFLTLDMGKICRFIPLALGRYGITLNFFRNEFGSETGDKLFISDMSDDRTEVKLTLLEPTDETLRSLFDWVDPSVPREDAQGLIDEAFGELTGSTTINVINTQKILDASSLFISDVTARLGEAGLQTYVGNLFSSLLSQIHDSVLNKMAADRSTNQIHSINISQYVAEAVSEILHTLQTSGSIDPRISIF